MFCSIRRVSVLPSKGDRVELLEPLGLCGVHDTLGRWDLVSGPIIEVGISNVPLSKIDHFVPLGVRNPGWDPTGLLGFALEGPVYGIGFATVEDEVGKLGNIGGISVVHLIFASIGGPTRTIPYCSI